MMMFVKIKGQAHLGLCVVLRTVPGSELTYTVKSKNTGEIFNIYAAMTEKAVGETLAAKKAAAAAQIGMPKTKPGKR